MSDGRIVKLNERFLMLSNLHLKTTRELEPLFFEVWTESLGVDKLKARVREIQTLRDIPVEFRVNSGEPVHPANAGISFLSFGDEECMLFFLEEDSESKKIELALASARDAALESARLKSEFLANISHEIRTPLNGVIGMTCLLRDTKLGSLQRNFTDTIRISADSLLNLINEILDFSKLEAGKLVVENAPFDLLRTIESTLDLLAERAQSKGIELGYLVQPDLPIHLMGDAGRCRQILTNLLGNAIKFTSEGDVTLKVGRDDDGEHVRFEISDTGIGIPREALPDLFQAFHQVDSSSTRRFEGTGLGLAISRQLVEVMGGSIGVSSTPDDGSSFWFTIPLRQQSDPPPPVPVPDKIRGARVLLVENNANTTESILTILNHYGIETDHVTSGADALAILKQAENDRRPFEIAILDMDTPDMDGLTLSRAIKAESSIAKTCVLILTTVTHQVETALLNASSIGACLTKPLKQSRILDYLQAAMSDQLDIRPAGGRFPELTDSNGGWDTKKSSAPLRVIIAEDNSINQKVAKGLLGRLGHPSDVVSDGKSLLRALELAPRDVVFMDCQLPEMDGLTATRQIRLREKTGNNGHRTYVVAMTADVVPGARERCIAAGMDDYLSKPIRLEELQAVIRRATEFVNLAARNGTQQLPVGYVDPSVMETLRLLKVPGQPDPLPLLIDEFIGAAQHRLEELQSAVIDQDFNTIEGAAHSLRGSSAGIGALRLAELSGELEEGVRNGSYHNSAALISRMDQEFLLVKKALEFEQTR